MSAPGHIFEKVTEKVTFYGKTRFLQVWSECSGTHFRKSHQKSDFLWKNTHLGGNRAPEAGGTLWPELGEPGGPDSIQALLRHWVRTLLGKPS